MIKEQLRDMLTLESGCARSESLEAHSIETHCAAKRAHPEITVRGLRDRSDRVPRESLLRLRDINREIVQRDRGGRKLAARFRSAIRFAPEPYGNESQRAQEKIPPRGAAPRPHESDDRHARNATRFGKRPTIKILSIWIVNATLPAPLGAHRGRAVVGAEDVGN